MSRGCVRSEAGRDWGLCNAGNYVTSLPSFVCAMHPSQAKLIHVAIQQAFVQGGRRGKHKQGDWVTEG